MALLQTQNPIIDIRGSAGGAVFSTDSSGLHLVSVKRSIRVRSPLQERRRRAFLSASQAWHSAVTLSNAALWILFAKQQPTQNGLGDTITLNAYQWFMKFNIYRIYNGLEPILEPPPE